MSKIFCSAPGGRSDRTATHGISRSLLLQWRRSFQVKHEDAAEQQTGFVPAMVVSEPAPPPPAALATSGAIEIELTSGIRITGVVDAATLTACRGLAGGRPR